MFEAGPITAPLINDKVNIISYHGWWHLHRFISNRHFIAASDKRTGLKIIEIIPDEIRYWRDRPPIIQGAYYNDKNERVAFVDQPFQPCQIELFQKLTLDQIESWIKPLGNNES